MYKCASKFKTIGHKFTNIRFYLHVHHHSMRKVVYLNDYMISNNNINIF